MLLLLTGLGGCGVTEAAERVAPVMGNGKYAHAPYLPHPGRDGAAMAAGLRSLGFKVTEPKADYWAHPEPAVVNPAKTTSSFNHDCVCICASQVG